MTLALLATTLVVSPAFGQDRSAAAALFEKGLGAMKAIEIAAPADRTPDAARAQKVDDLARTRGLLLLKAGTAKNVIRLLPPLTTPPDELGRGLDILAGACHEVLA